jgi:hypothetical protein
MCKRFFLLGLIVIGAVYQPCQAVISSENATGLTNLSLVTTFIGSAKYLEKSALTGSEKVVYSLIASAVVGGLTRWWSNSVTPAGLLARAHDLFPGSANNEKLLAIVTQSQDQIALIEDINCWYRRYPTPLVSAFNDLMILQRDAEDALIMVQEALSLYEAGVWKKAEDFDLELCAHQENIIRAIDFIKAHPAFTRQYQAYEAHRAAVAAVQAVEDAKFVYRPIIFYNMH